MPFQPGVGDSLTIDGLAYAIAVHPSAPGMPYGQEGRAGIVYQLLAPDSEEAPAWGGDPAHRALKLFKPRYRVPALVALTERLAAYADLPGLEVCHRAVLTPQLHGPLLHQHPDLTYAVLMPWIDGPTWMEVMLDQRALTPEQSLVLTRSLVELLAAMEQRSLAHCDLSAPNVLLPALADPPPFGPHTAVALVDVEQLFAPGLDRPEVISGGSPGYAAHRTSTSGVWESRADRFAGAVLIGEILAWSDERVREAAWGETYFDDLEMQQESLRFRVLMTTLSERWGEPVAGLFDRAWRSESLADCPTFGEWLVMLPDAVPTAERVQATTAEQAQEPAPTDPDTIVRGLLDVARRLEQQGNTVAALEVYEQARMQASPGSGLAQELNLIIEQLKSEIVSAAERARPAPTLTQATADTDPAAFFQDGLDAYDRREWARARELLGEAARRLPDNSRDKGRALRLIADAEKQLAGPVARPRWGLVALAAAVLAIAAAGWFFYQAQATATAEARALAAQAEATSQAMIAAEVQATAQAMAVAQLQAAISAQATATARAQPTTASTAVPTATPTVDESWQVALDVLEDFWEDDWPRAIGLIEVFRQRFPGYRPADEKLYAALVAHGKKLVAEGQKDDGLRMLTRAHELIPSRGEANAALLALTPTSTPTPEPTATPEPVRVPQVVPGGPAVPPGPRAPVAPPGGAPTKSPLTPR